MPNRQTCSDLCRSSFMKYCRLYKVESGRLKPFAKMDKSTILIGVRYNSEMRDRFIGQPACMHTPHRSRDQLYPDSGTDIEFPYVRCLLGFLNYLLHQALNDDGTIRIGSSDYYATRASYPLPLPIRSGCTAVFRTRADAFGLYRRGTLP